MASILSTGKTKKVATRVFGESVFNDMDASLCYSPSPGPVAHTGVIARGKAKSKSCAIRSSILEDSELTMQSTPSPTVLFQPDASADQPSTTLISEKRVSFAPDDTENTDGSFSGAPSLTSKAASRNSIRDAELNRLRANKTKSPLRANLIKLTEAVINDVATSIQRSALKEKNQNIGPSSSVYQSVNAGRNARMNVVRKKHEVAKSVSFKWDKEKAEAKSLQKKVEENRRQIRAIQRKLTSAHFKDKARQDEAQKLDRLDKLEKEYMFKSKVFQDHQQKLKEERDRNRKKSIDARANIRRNVREGEDVLKAKKLEEDKVIFEVRADLHRSRMETKKANAERRRKSFQFRAGDARKIRDMRSAWREKDLQDQHAGYELSRAAAKDVANYKKRAKKEECDDFKKRNQDANESRKRQNEQRSKALLVEHMSYELKWQGERDAEAYRKKMKEERRKSLAGRNKESARHARVMEELRAIANEKEAESFMLKFNADNDAKAYIAKLAEERRKSLQLRGQEARKRRQYEDEQHSKAIENALKEGALQSDCQRDVEKHKAECAERRRKSFQYRGKQAHLQRLEEEERRLDQMQKDEEGHKLDALAQKDVEEYYKDCQRRRRKSLALRAKERRQHVEWTKKKQQKELQDRAHTSHLNSLDVHHMALAKEREHALRAMDALRNAGCTWKGNPFGDLLSDL
mmetsp:Transcript_13390/g.37707  ORF Transcript_13390/g.37707 Transcript_13390/m.37707 type:complete len:691 (+) Transcript_13390:165-2237(+)|eukprot:CAMPEP_0172367018 /NCGR_PEP_ID=MMETSP1060-20121228/18261_1 /TAXON_ID=37318 /ORGANISM="Pseudo-nitzschia pungens, Strain cf. cingulata" /LENGTH=690 /DNA_ID=CAMNT_0013091077 /DNA_START=127 /DNA_END=2199 /DNA_ORIENTATION=+